MPDRLINAPTAKEAIALLEWFLSEYPDCNPIAEMNNDEPSVENVFIVPWESKISCAYTSGTNILINVPTMIDSNKIAATPRVTLPMRIFPSTNPKIISEKNRLMGERRIEREDIIAYLTFAYSTVGFRDTLYEIC